MYVVYSDRHKLHDTTIVLAEGYPLNSFEVPARAEAILGAIQAAQLGPIVDPTDHGLRPIQAVHDPGYLDFLRTVYSASEAHFGEGGPVMTWTFANRHGVRKPNSFSGLKGYYAFGWGTPILEGTWEAAYWSAQCALTAADLVLRGERVAYALCRPPGHHAGPDLYGGYCYLNNAAIVARYLQSTGDRTNSETAKVAILDVDYHHGNGTQIIFYSDPSVYYCSLHAHPDEEYPYYWGGEDERGQGAGMGTNYNWPLPLGTEDAQYLASLDEALAVLAGLRPRYLVVSVGFDTIAGDPEGGFRLTVDGIAQVAQKVAGLQLPVILIQEGGYLLGGLAQNAAAFLETFSQAVEVQPDETEDLHA